MVKYLQIGWTTSPKSKANFDIYIVMHMLICIMDKIPSTLEWEK